MNTWTYDPNTEKLLDDSRNHVGYVERSSGPLASAAPELLTCLRAAIAFIDSHCADPDITERMAITYNAFLATKPLEVIAKATKIL